MFRVKINLNQFFNDYRKNAFTTVDPESWSSVKNLENHIVKLFNLPTNIYLTTDDGVHIPSLENISIIRPKDTLVVHPSVDGTSNNNSLHVVIASTSRGRKYSEEDFSAGAPESLDDLDIKRKRKRKRPKKKAKECGLSFEEVSEKLNEIFKPVPAITSSKYRKHVRFDEEDNDDTNSESVNATEFRIKPIVQSSPLQNITPTVPKVYRAIEVSPIEIDDKEEDVKENPEKEEIEVHQSFEDKGSPTGCSDKKSDKVLEVKNSAMEDIRKNVDALDLNSLTDTPKENDVIAFKYLKLNENYMPVISDYIVGMIESVDEENKNLKIYILAGNEEDQKKKVTNGGGKFSLPDMDAEEVDDSGTLVLNCKDLLDAKVIKI